MSMVGQVPEVCSKAAVPITAVPIPMIASIADFQVQGFMTGTLFRFVPVLCKQGAVPGIGRKIENPRTISERIVLNLRFRLGLGPTSAVRVAR